MNEIRVGDDLAKLTDLLRYTERGLFAFAMYGELGERARLSAELAQRLHDERQVVEMALSDAEPDLARLIEKNLANGAGQGGEAKPAIFVMGFERLTGETLSQIYFALNLRRDRLNTFDLPIVFWLTEPQLVSLLRHAPDLFSQRSGIYDFRVSVPEGHELARIIPDMLGTFSKSLIPAEELRKRVTLFENTLKRLQGEKEPNEAAIASVYQDLGIIHHQPPNASATPRGWRRRLATSVSSTN